VGDPVVCIYALDGDGAGVALERPESPSGQDLWVHLQSDAAECPAYMRSLGVPETAVEIMTAIDTRPRVLSFDQGTLIVLRGVNTVEGSDPEDMVSLRIWLTDKVIVTARKTARVLMSIQDIRKLLDQGRGPTDSYQFLVDVLELLTDRIAHVVDDVEEQLEDIEEHLIDLRSVELRTSLTVMRRRAAQLKRYLAPQREALDSLYRVKIGLNERLASSLREQTDRTTRFVEDLDLSRERSILLQEELRNQIAEMQNERMYVLSIVTAIFLPLSFLTGVFGMNVMGLPGVENPRGFVLVAGGMALIGVCVALWMRLRKWV
jgi:zinc transporter